MGKIVESYEEFLENKNINETHLVDVGYGSEYNEEYWDGVDARLINVADGIAVGLVYFPLDKKGKRIYGKNLYNDGGPFLKLEFTPLFLKRDLIDGWEIEVYDNDHIGTLKVDINKEEIFINDKFYKTFSQIKETV
jgi:hypothetical protein